MRVCIQPRNLKNLRNFQMYVSVSNLKTWETFKCMYVCVSVSNLETWETFKCMYLCMRVCIQLTNLRNFQIYVCVCVCIQPKNLDTNTHTYTHTYIQERESGLKVTVAMRNKPKNCSFCPLLLPFSHCCGLWSATAAVGGANGSGQTDRLTDTRTEMATSAWWMWYWWWW